MHYADGTEAKLGDVVVGKGYNIKDSAGHLKTISGVIHSLVPGADSCNCQVLILQPVTQEHAASMYVHGHWRNTVLIGGKLYLQTVEYGQCDHFNLATPRVPA